MAKFEEWNPAPWSCPGWRDGCVFDDNGEPVCVVNDNETRAVIAAAPTMLHRIETYAADTRLPQALRDECQALSDAIRQGLWQDQSRRYYDKNVKVDL